MSIEKTFERIATALETIASVLSSQQPVSENASKPEKKVEKKETSTKTESKKPKPEEKTEKSKPKTTKPKAEPKKEAKSGALTEDDVRKKFSSLVKVKPRAPKEILTDLGVQALSKLDRGDYQEAIDMADKILGEE